MVMVSANPGGLQMLTRHQKEAADRAAAVADGDATALTVKEALRRSPVRRSSLYVAITSGALPSHKLGRSRVIMLADLNNWIEGRSA
jgi:excisionase family DNA binding protein